MRKNPRTIPKQIIKIIINENMASFELRKSDLYLKASKKMSLIIFGIIL